MKDLLNNTTLINEIQHNDIIESGTIIRRIGTGKDQQGYFMNFDDDGDIILVNVIDIISKSYETPAGILMIREGDRLFRYTTRFGKDKLSRDAELVLREWPLYKKNPALQEPMLYFMTHAFSPDLVLYLRENDSLDYLFIPIQQKFKVGRYRETVNWAKIRKDKFKGMLDSLKSGSHLTYIAMIPPTKSYTPMFYSIGTKPHQETEIALRSEPFNFVPTHGGHIKAMKAHGNTLRFIVDAGSNFIGKGVKTSIATAKEVTDALASVYRTYSFIPMEGRGAFGETQSY
jgi:hypothetical protein